MHCDNSDVTEGQYDTPKTVQDVKPCGQRFFYGLENEFDIRSGPWRESQERRQQNALTEKQQRPNMSKP